MSDNNITSLLKAGAALLDENKFKEAITIFNQVIQANPKNADAYFLKANALQSLNDLPAALDFYNQSLKLNPKSPEVVYNKGNCLKKLNRIDEALLSYERVLYYSPNHALAHNQRGLCLVQLKKYEDALKAFSDAVTSDPRNYGAFYNMGNCYHYMQKYKDALECYEKSLKIKEENSDAYFNKGNAHDELKEYDKALECYDLAIKHKPEMTDAHFNKGLVLYKKADFKSAIKNYDNAIMLNPKNDDAFFHKGVCLGELKEYREAVKTLTRAINLKPDNPGYISERATAYLELKQVLDGFNDLNFARKILEEEENVKSYSKEMVLRSKKNVEKINSIDVLDVLGLFSEKIEFLDGNREIKKEFVKLIKPEIEKKFGVRNSLSINGNNKNNFDKFLHGANDNENFISNNQEKKLALPSDVMIDFSEDANSKKTSERSIANKKANLAAAKETSPTKLLISNEQGAKTNKIKSVSDKNVHDLVLKDKNKEDLMDNNGKESANASKHPNSEKSVAVQFNQQNVTKISNVINLTSTTITKPLLSKEELKKIYDLLFTVNEKVKKHELKISKLAKKIEQIESELETKLTNHRKKLEKELDSMIAKNILTEDNKKKLMEYFNGFNSCFNRFYLTSQMIIQDQFKLTDNNCISICSFLVSLVPVVGAGLAVAGKGVANYLRSMVIKNQAKKFVGLAADCTDLSQKIGNCSFEICKNSKMHDLLGNIVKQDVDKMLVEDYCFVKKLAVGLENKINFLLFDPEDRSVYNKYGEYDANRIIKRFLKNEFNLDVEYEVQFAEFILNSSEIEERKKINDKVVCGCIKSGVCVVF